MVFPALFSNSCNDINQFQSLVGVYGFSRLSEGGLRGSSQMFQSLVGVYGFSRATTFKPSKFKPRFNP